MTDIPAGQLAKLHELIAKQPPLPGTRTWDEDRCAECCWSDRCSDPTHFFRDSCPHCLGTGYALWLPKFQPTPVSEEAKHG